MVTPLEERLPRRRGASPIRTPRLTRDYLAYLGGFPEDPAEERAAPQGGLYRPDAPE